MFAYGILKVIYSPFKAFKEIIQDPKYAGPLLILILFVLASVGSGYARASKMYVQQTLPSSLDPSNPDPWTENCSMWTSNANVTCNSHDRILGYNSIQFEATSDVAIWMKLSNIGQIDCLSPEGYKNLTLGIKWVHPTADQPQNASIYLYSMGTTDYFLHDLTEFIETTETDTWRNFTIPIGPNTGQWVSSNHHNAWNNITDLKLEVVWSKSAGSNLTVLLDRLFFQSEKFEPFINLMGSNIASSALDAVIGFSFYWVLFAVLISFASKLFKIKSELKVFLVIVGYALIAMVIMEILFCVFYLMISPIYLSLDVIAPTSVLQTILSFSFYATLLPPVLSIILSSIGVHVASGLPLSRSTLLATIGFLPYYILFFIA